MEQLSEWSQVIELDNPSKSKTVFVYPTKSIMGLILLTLSPMLLESASIDWSVIYMRDIFSTPPIVNGLSIVVLAIAQFIVRFNADFYVEKFGAIKISHISIYTMFIGVLAVSLSLILSVVLKISIFFNFNE